MSVSRLNSWSGLSHKNEVITRTYGTGALRFKSCARLSEEIRVTAAAKCAGGIHSSRAWADRSNSHAATPQWVMLTGVLMCCGAHLIWVAHNAPNPSNTESQDIPPPPTTWNGIAPRPHPPPLVYLRLLLLSPPSPVSSSSTTSSSSPPSRPNSGAPPIGRQDFPFSAKMEEEVSRLMKGAEIVWPDRIVLLNSYHKKQTVWGYLSPFLHKRPQPWAQERD